MADFAIEYHGTITLVRPLTDLCRSWLDENVQAEGWQWFGGALAVEPRCMERLYEDMTLDGLEGEE